MPRRNRTQHVAAPRLIVLQLVTISNGFGNEGALVLSELLTSNGSLRKVDVCSNGITSRGLCALGPAAAHHPSMQEMSIWGNRFDSAACLAWLPATTALVLDISVSEVDGAYHCVRV